MKKKQYYYPPRLELTSVKAETGFMNASVVTNDPDDNSTVFSGNQEISDSYDFTTDNESPWK